MVQIKPGTFCPLIKKDCVQMKCNWFMQIRGYDTNTGKDIDEWGCAVTWLPTLLIENSNQMRQAGAATESFRNEMVKASEKTAQAILLATENVSTRLVNENKEIKVISYENNDS